MNPLLENLPLPRFSAIGVEHVMPAIDNVLAQYQQGVDTLLTQTPSWANTMAPQESLSQALGNAFAPVAHLHSVKDSAELREVYALAEEKLTEFSSAMGQNRPLFEAVQAVRDSAEFAGLSAAQKMIVEDALRDFRLSGVALEEPARSRFRDIAKDLSRLSTEFEQAVLDATQAWFLDLDDDTRLQGIPESGLATLAQYAKAAERESGYRVTLHQPSVQAVMTYAQDRELRREVYFANQTRASDQGPHAGQFDNSARINAIVALKHEAAQLLGFANSAEESLVTKMAQTPEKVLAFLNELVVKAKPVAEAEMAELKTFAAKELGIADFQVWDMAYAAEKLRMALHQLSEEELKPYFPLNAVMDGLFEVTQRLFNVKIVAREQADVWHADVTVYDIQNASGETIATMYWDVFARSGKRGGAWMDHCRSRFREGDQLHKPVAFLNCNFSMPSAAMPCLLTHDEVITLFHEFGHGLHHMLTEVDFPSVSGIAGVEWDAVELPSQFMENFCWTREALDLFARHYKTGEKLPETLFQRMLAAKHFHAGLFLVRQLELALFDFRLHLEFQSGSEANPLAMLNDVRKQVSVFAPPEWQRFPHAFTHIFSGGYAAGYYSYLWAEVLSADAFSRFEQAGVFDAQSGADFRRSVLAVGGSRPALQSFVEFLGREPKPDALLRSYGLAA